MTQPLSDPVDIVRAFLSRMEILDHDGAAPLLAADVAYINPPPIGAVRGPAGVRAVLEPFFAPTLENEFRVLRQAADQLMDHELPPEDREKIVRLITEDRRLTDVHQLRTRAAGPYIHMQMHVDLDAELTLEAAHEVIVAAEKRLLAAFPSADILIHADPRGRAEPHGGAFAEMPVADAQ